MKVRTVMMSALVSMWLGAQPSGAPGPTPIDACQPQVPLTTGSYVLTQNLLAPQGTNGLVIGGNNITIDLAGFTIEQVVSRAGGEPGGSAITDALMKRRNIAIRNGTFTRFQRGGITLGQSGDVTIESVRAIANRNATGLYVGGTAIVKDCIVSSNIGSINPTNVAVCVGAHSVVTGNTVNQNDMCSSDR